MERKQFATLTAIASVTMPGDQIRHSSWPEGKTYTCSTEFLRAYGDYPHAAREVTWIKDMPPTGRGGHWLHAGKYPPRPNDVVRGIRSLINKVPAASSV